jgi:hypothetical protein
MPLQSLRSQSPETGSVMILPMTMGAGEVFRMTIRVVYAFPSLSARPGLYMGGKIESGVLHVGDDLTLMDGDLLVRQV